MDELNIDHTAPLPRPPDGPPPRRRFGTGARIAAGLAVIALLAGGSVLGFALSGGGRPATGAALAANTRGSVGGGNAAGGSDKNAAAATKSSGSPGTAAWQAPAARRVGARLRACFASARHLRASGHRAAARVRLRACIRRYVRFRLGMAVLRLHRLRMLIRHTLHGQITIQTRNGPRTVAFERGAIQSVSPQSLVVRAGDGTTLTWVVGASTKVIKACQPVGLSALAAGQRVVVLGPVSAGSDHARRVFVIGEARS